MSKVTISVSKAFQFNREAGMTQFAVGQHEVEQAVADHFYVKAHCGELPAPANPTNNMVAEELATALARIAKLEEAHAALSAVKDPKSAIKELAAKLADATALGQAHEMHAKQLQETLDAKAPG